MARPTVIIGCRLPNGLKITHPIGKQSVTLAGLNSSKIIGSTHVTTEVDAEFWDTWKAAYADYAPLKNGAIFESRNETEALAKSKELRKEKTGFEPMSQETKDIKKADK